MDSRGSLISHLETKIFAATPIVLLSGAGAALFLQSHFHPHSPRTQYGIRHLPEALLLAALFIAIAGFVRTILLRSSSVEERSTFYYLGAIVIAFALCWLPVLLTGRFVQDDWSLLAAAAIRKIIYIHPSYAWFSLDTVDGNFRPLGTTLYFAYMLRSFGAHAFAFLCGNFIVNLSGSVVVFFLVRELGYSKIAGAAASLLYMSRGLNYIENAWACALGDGMVILLGGLTVLGILRANKRQGVSAFVYHAVAWIFFCIALFAKQSSFAIPLIVALLILLRPGDTALAPLRQRVSHTVLALIAYSVPAAIVFLHAKTLFRGQIPYPIHITPGGFTQWLSYIPWYFVGIQFPYKVLDIPTKCAGVAILIAAAIFVARVPRALGKRPRDIVFLLLAALAGISPFLFLPTRTAPYYGTMSAFWISIALGIALTQFGAVSDKNPSARNAYFALYLFVIVGVLDIRLKETALIPSGGYIRGTYGMDEQKMAYDKMTEIFAKHPSMDTLVMVNFSVPAPDYTSMALFADPKLRRILVYDSRTKTFLTNDLAGLRPKDGLEELNDLQAYYWNIPVDCSAAAKIAAQNQALWIEFTDGEIRAVAPLASAAGDQLQENRLCFTQPSAPDDGKNVLRMLF